eukprot:TRINITY_DN3222_c1_g1_i4.p1 TRINITY_DN3222_c1_g1~~TRINITY_DN3222_c1_g1_i4.p1  ORF type:complete len:495 (+),score=226.74 TRINITY_DN3222_c1_g1_i4:292-1776(+)
MANVNIPRDIKDEFYRYKMPCIISKVEGRGNGIKTYIVNMADIAKSLARPASYPTKFFGFELGAITTIEPEKDRYGVNGKHDTSKLASVLDDFIEKFVLCKQCQRNPETVMVIDKAGGIELNCKACGGRSPVDLRHKLCGFIVKNPPPKEKKLKRAKKVAEQEEDKEDPRIDGEETATAIPGSRKSKKGKDDDDDDDDVEWFTDTSKAAAEQRKKAMLSETSELAAKLLSTNISEEKKADPVERLIQFIATKPNDDSLLVEIQKVKNDAGFDEEATARALTLALYHVDFLKRIEADKGASLKKVVTNEKAQNGVLAAVVDLCSGKDNPMLKISAHILKALYDNDVLEEDAILSWASTKSKTARRVLEAAKPFTDWLQEAEEDEDDDEEEDEEEEDDEEEEEDEEEEDEEEEDEEEEDEEEKDEEEEDEEEEDEEEEDEEEEEEEDEESEEEVKPQPKSKAQPQPAKTQPKSQPQAQSKSSSSSSSSSKPQPKRK